MNRSETILATIRSLLTGLSTTGANVERDRVHPVGPLPSLSIELGESRPAGVQSSLREIEVEMEFSVFIYVKTENLSTQLNQINAEVFAALLGSDRLGLSYVNDLKWLGDDAPALTGEQEQPTASLESKYLVNYYHSLVSKES